MQGFYMVSGVLMCFTEWPFQAFYEAGEVDSVVPLIFIIKVNFCVSLQQARSFQNFIQVLGPFLFCVTARPVWRCS